MSVTVIIFGEHSNFADCFIRVLCRDACEKLWGEELKDLVEDRGRRGLFC